MLAKVRISKIETFLGRAVLMVAALALAPLAAGCGNDPISKLWSSSVLDDRFGGAIADLEAPTAPASVAWQKPYDSSTSQTSSFSWTAASDTGTGVHHYQVALGTTSGDTNTVAWTNVGAALSYQFSSVALTTGVPYFASVRAVDGAGNVGPAVTTPYLFTVVTETPSFDLDLTAVSTLPPTYRMSRTGAAGTYFDSSGMIRTGVTNLLLQNENFNTTWSKNATTVSIDVALSPNEITSGDAVLETSTTAAHSVSQSVAGLANGSTYTLSVYAKAAGRTQLAISLSGVAFAAGPSATFDLQNGTVIASSGGALTTTLTSAGNGWYRLRLTATTSAAGAGVSTFAMRNGTGAVEGASSYLGDITKGVALWGSQLEQNDKPLSVVYTTTTSATGARFDYDPATCTPGPCVFRGLMEEAARINRVLQNGAYASANWDRSNVTASVSTQASPMVGVNANLITETLDGSAVVHNLGQQTLAMAANATHSASVYVKPNGRTRFKFGFYRVATADAVSATFDLVAKTAVASMTGAGAGARAFLQPLPNGWFRLEVVGNVSTVVANAVLTLQTMDAIGASYTGDGTSGYYVWGAQFETGPRASSVLPSTTGAVTRNADSTTSHTIASWVGNAGGTLAVRSVIQSEDSNSFPVIVRLCIAATCSLNKFEMQVYGTHPAYIYLLNNINTYYSLQYNVGYSQTAESRMMFAFALNDFRGGSNGVLAPADNGGSMFQPDQLTFSGQGWFKRITYWRERLTDAQLEAYTR